eukprot:5243380-Karenia_brevis.AAC.1
MVFGHGGVRTQGFGRRVLASGVRPRGFGRGVSAAGFRRRVFGRRVSAVAVFRPQWCSATGFRPQ